MIAVRTFATLIAVAAIGLASATLAQTQSTPIPGIDVAVKKQPEGVLIASGQTDAYGEMVLKDLPAGDYDVLLSGKGVIEYLEQKGAIGTIKIQTAGTWRPEIIFTKPVGSAVEGVLTLTEQDATTKFVLLTVSADSSTWRGQN